MLPSHAAGRRHVVQHQVFHSALVANARPRGLPWRTNQSVEKSQAMKSAAFSAVIRGRVLVAGISWLIRRKVLCQKGEHLVEMLQGFGVAAGNGVVLVGIREMVALQAGHHVDAHRRGGRNFVGSGR